MVPNLRENLHLLYNLRKARLLISTLSIRKIINFLLIYLSFYISRFLGKSFHLGMPIKVGFEPTTHCNLRCPECPSGLRSFTRPTGIAPLKLFKNTIDQLHKELVYLLLYFQGEPFLHPDFLQMVSHAHERGIYTATSTNGHFMTPKKAQETVESGLSEVIFSIDGTTQETYSSYRIGGKLEKVKEGVRNLVKARTEAASLHPFIVIQFLVVKPNEHQVEDVQNLVDELGADQLVLKTAQVYDFEQGNALIPNEDKFSRYRKTAKGTYELKNKLENQCWKLWHGAEITWDGKVLPCCFDKDAQYEMGTLENESFTSIWHGRPYEEFRNKLLSSRKEIDICKNCSEGTQVWA